MDYIYDAFISYRHLPPDQTVAEKLQTLLETRKKKDGKKLRVFRDKTDFPSSSDLSSEIRKALEQSRYLIVVCSPDYQLSAWCMAELNYFRQLHGGNDNIRTVLVAGEPKESFPEVLRHQEETVIDQNGDPFTGLKEVVPLAADVRGDDDKDRLKKLHVEYLRIAAPLLDATFDQLYQRAHRKKLAVLSAVIAALMAFLAYSGFLFMQIRQRQKLLEAKQQELYQNESVRLANEAMLLIEDDPALAMLLAYTALPEDLQNPDYPVTQAADVSIRTVALQHMYAEATEPFSPKARIILPNSDCEFGTFYDNDHYFTIIDNFETRLYDAHTGMLVGAIPSQEVFFFEGGERCVYESGTTSINEEHWYVYSVCDVRTGEELWQVTVADLPETYPMLEYERDTGRLWVVDTTWGDPLGPPPEDEVHWESAHGWFDQEGAFHEDHTGPEASGSFVTVFYRGRGSRLYHFSNSSAGPGFEYRVYRSSLPEEYQRVIDAVEHELNGATGAGPYEAKTISKSADGSLYILGLDIYSEESLYVVWSAVEERLVWLDEYACFLDSDGDLLYRVMEHELQIYEVNPENFGLPQAAPIFDYVSENGMYGFGSIRAAWGDEAEWTFFAYDTAKLKDVEYLNEWSETGNLLEMGDYQYVSRSYYPYDITPDGTRLVIAEEENSISFVDITSGETLFRLDTTGQDVIDLAVNDDGTLFACMVSFEGTVNIVLVDTEDRAYIWETQLDECYFVHLEFLDHHLLVGGYGTLRLFNLEELDQEPQRIQLFYSYDEFDVPPGQSVLTADGLLVVPTHISSFSAPTPITVQKIFDTQNWEEIDFQTRDAQSNQYQNYCYDSVGGNLILQYADDYCVQRRGESGDFEVVYTITSRHDNMMMDSAGHACDGTWLVLQNEEYCEIYRLEDGVLCYTVRKPNDRNCQLGVIDGRLYDFCAGWNRVSIPLPDTAQAKAYIQDALSCDGGRRTLSDQEMKDYYIPSHWREK